MPKLQFRFWQIVAGRSGGTSGACARTRQESKDLRYEEAWLCIDDFGFWSFAI